jgi:hypothetical protein
MIVICGHYQLRCGKFHNKLIRAILGYAIWPAILGIFKWELAMSDILPLVALALFLFLSLCIAAVIWMEVRHSGTKWVKALRDWQSGLGALFGLVSVALSLSVQVLLQDYSKRTETIDIVAALYLDASATDNWLGEMSTALSKISSAMPGYGDLSDDKHRADFCTWAAAELKKMHRIDEGAFDGQKVNIGRADPKIAYLFIELNSNWRKFNASFLDGVSGRCRFDRIDFVPAMTREVEYMRRTFESIRMEMKIGN